MIGIGAHQRAQFPGLQIIACVFADVQLQGGAARRVGGGRLDAELAVAGRTPRPGFVVTSAAAGDGDAVGDDEGGIKAHAELTDQLGVDLVASGDAVEEPPRAGMRDGAQVLHQLVVRHADAVVADRERARVGVDRQIDGQFAVVGQQGGIVDGFEAQLLAGVGGVGHQLAQEDVLVGIQRMNDQLQHLLHIGLKGVGFDRWGRGGGVGAHPGVLVGSVGSWRGDWA